VRRPRLVLPLTPRPSSRGGDRSLGSWSINYGVTNYINVHRHSTFMYMSCHYLSISLQKKMWFKNHKNPGILQVVDFSSYVYFMTTDDSRYGTPRWNSRYGTQLGRKDFGVLLPCTTGATYRCCDMLWCCMEDTKMVCLLKLIVMVCCDL
jgi:hypothetical protein